MASTHAMTETHCLQRKRIAPAHVRYIKLGSGNAWADACIAEGRIAFGHGPVSHALAAEGDWEAVRSSWDDLSASKASDFLREVRDFYELGSDCLWITFHRGRMWWAFAEAEVVEFDAPSEVIGTRYRRVIGAWRSKSVSGKPLILNDISTRLSKTAAYRQTLCRIEAADYAVRLINDEASPEARQAEAARARFVETLLPLIRSLHENDFELLVDLIFNRLGWVRISGIGGAQKDFDLILEQPATKARALVQIKSAADQAIIEDYEARLAEQPADHAFLICHSPAGQLKSDTLMIWSGADVADRVMEAGLTEWLIRKAT